MVEVVVVGAVDVFLSNGIYYFITMVILFPLLIQISNFVSIEYYLLYDQ